MERKELWKATTFLNGTPIQAIDTTAMPRKTWEKVRAEVGRTAIGGSEIGAAMGLSIFKSPLKLWYQKLGLSPPFDDVNLQMTIGILLEDAIAELWRYAKAGDTDIPEHFVAEQQPRACVEYHAIVRNPRFDWIFGNVDRVITKHPRFGENIGILEIKKIHSWYADKFASGYPEQYRAQVDMYGMILQCPYTELVMLMDANGLPIHTFEFDLDRARSILEKSYGFVESLRAGHSIIRRYSSEWKVLQELQRIEPAVDNLEETRRFLSEKHKAKENLIEAPADAELIELALAYVDAKAQADDARDRLALYGNQIRKIFQDRNLRKATWSSGYISYWKKLMVKA